MEGGAGAFVDGVGAHRVAYLAEDFAVAHEFVDEHLAVLVVHVVVAGAVDEE